MPVDLLTESETKSNLMEGYKWNQPIDQISVIWSARYRAESSKVVLSICVPFY